MSNINPNTINGAYPVAGIDNDSQGFRDNFTNIKNNLAFAQAEITDLQQKAVVKSALTGITLNNNMAGTVISSAQIQDFRETQIDLGTIGGTTATLDHSRGHYHSVRTNGAVTIAFQNFPPAGTVGRLRLKLIVNNANHTLIVPASVVNGTQYIDGYNYYTNTISFIESGIGTYYFEFVSDDNGATVTIIDLNRARLKSDYSYYNVAASGSNPTSLSNVSITSGKLVLDSSTLSSAAYVGVIFPSFPIDGLVVTVSTTIPLTNVYFFAGNNISTGYSLGGTTNTSYTSGPLSISANTHVGFTFVGSPSNPSVNKWIRTQV
jgi:hypothetical protein